MEKYEKNPAVSIILPVYNSGIYLDTAINSILEQDFKDFELIIIDDGSTDGSSYKCDSFSNKDQRIKVFHQENKGICISRNRALDVAKGEYITFLDHDDKYHPNFLNKAYTYCKENNLDILKFGYNTIKIKNNRIISVKQNYIYNNIFKPEEIATSFWNLALNKTLDAVWDGMYKREFIIKNKVRFNPIFINGGEDIDFIRNLITYKPVLGTLNQTLYNHYIRYGFSTSTSYKEVMVTNLMNWQDRLFKYLDKMEIHINKNNAYLYTQLTTEEQIGALCDILNSPQCKLPHSKKILYLKEIKSTIHCKTLFSITSPIKYILDNKKYGILYFLFKHQCYTSCLFLYKIKNLIINLIYSLK